MWTADNPKEIAKRQKDEIPESAIDRVATGEIRYDAAEEETPPKDYRLAFNIVALAVAVLLGAVILLRLKRRNG
jgi:hypothetical protein